ncbi:hypothetical protein H4Q26_010347 [Puccinia striiformis f. sp. tritici PST-130]|nr:hypothetical protein H4Q26_010347 [Puccinia striiformis f. sp. tritici PST-130]
METVRASAASLAVALAVISLNSSHLVFASSDHLSKDGVPEPQAATPPTPHTFDASDETEMEEDVPADPAPATPPTPFLQSKLQPDADGSNSPLGSNPGPTRENTLARNIDSRDLSFDPLS